MTKFTSGLQTKITVTLQIFLLVISMAAVSAIHLAPEQPGVKIIKKGTPHDTTMNAKPVDFKHLLSDRTLRKLKKLEAKKNLKNPEWKKVTQKDIGKSADLRFIQSQWEKVDMKLDLDTYEDMIYSTEIFIGNPPQKIRALFDTGSSKFWVAGNKVDKNYSVPHNYYNPEQSVSAKSTGEKATSLYGSGSCKGELYLDDVWIGKEEDVKKNNKDKVVQIKNFTIGVMEE